MTRSNIIAILASKHQKFSQLVYSLSEQEFMAAKAGKWTACQHMDHILRSITPLAQVLKDPGYLLSRQRATSHTASRDYPTVVESYVAALAKGGTASGPFLPQTITISQRASLVDQFQQEVNRLCVYIEHYSEDQLDAYLLAHPLLGKLTLREMLYFTIYHVEHHHNQVLQQLNRQEM